MSKANNNRALPAEQTEAIDRILTATNSIYRAMQPGIPNDWLTSNLTVAQLRILLFLHVEGPKRMSDIAAYAGITLPTATGIVDKLFRKDLVRRESDAEDRRSVICRLSPQGIAMLSGVWNLGRLQIERMLNGLTMKQLKNAEEVALLILANIKPANPDHS
jgi:DNA-binding MarR family transcriptional regulator